MVTWFEVISELFVNVAAAWFVVVFIEPQITALTTREKILALMFRLFLGILSLFIAKYFRDKSRRKK